MGSRHRRSSCTCTWSTVTAMPKIPVMTHRMATCPQHGDDTEWWARTRKVAESLKYGHSGRDVRDG